MSKLKFKISLEREVTIEIDKIAFLFANGDKNKQECFLGFTKENQLKWCKNNIKESDLKTIKNINKGEC